jgi:hypothetical protein
MCTLPSIDVSIAPVQGKKPATSSTTLPSTPPPSTNTSDPKETKVSTTIVDIDDTKILPLPTWRVRLVANDKVV